MAGTGGGIEYRLIDRWIAARFMERPAMNAGRALVTCTTKKDLATITSWGDGCTGSWPGLGGQVTTATPLLPSRELARTAIGKL